MKIFQKQTATFNLPRLTYKKQLSQQFLKHTHNNKKSAMVAMMVTTMIFIFTIGIFWSHVCELYFNRMLSNLFLPGGSKILRHTFDALWHTKFKFSHLSLVNLNSIFKFFKDRVFLGVCEFFRGTPLTTVWQFSPLISMKLMSCKILKNYSKNFLYISF